MAFERLDLKAVSCFGWSRPDKSGETGWSSTARKCVSFGWSDESARKINDGLAADVSRSFGRIASGRFVDLDTQVQYRAYFDNSKGLWFLEIVDSPKADVLDEDLQGFFGSEEFGSFARRCAQLALQAKDVYEKVVKEHLEDGELLGVNEQKLEWILRDLGVGRFVDNLRGCRYGKK